jgi:hypothetical protein
VVGVCRQPIQFLLQSGFRPLVIARSALPYYDRTADEMNLVNVGVGLRKVEVGKLREDETVQELVQRLACKIGMRRVVSAGFDYL